MTRPRTLFSLLLIAVLLVVGLAAPKRMNASPVADFAAPMSAQEAQARVSAAQQADLQRRNAIARTLGATSADTLPFVQNLFFSQTNHHVSGRAGFLNYWRENGGVLIFGYPISEEIVEDGRVVQYFERARFEYHPENIGKEGQIQLSLLGSQLTAGRAFPEATPDMGTQYFPETKHTLSGKFLKFWLKRGGLEIFGYPISEPFDEVSPSDGQIRTTQYFERARFEYHPEALDGFYQQMAQANGLLLAGLHEIELGDLGRQAAQRKGHAFGGSPQLSGAPDWAPTIWSRRIDVDLSAQRLIAYEGDTPVYHAPVATGKDGFNTPTGSYAIYSKYPIETMTGSAGGETWYVPDIPFVQYVVGGVALHGTYWHDQWGTGVRMSHGCINLNIDDAEWLYGWADVGTHVDIHY
ncbi:MAG TPA: L,D-transpeptidase [Roseiflexaceae bacterium]|nr:L,D-transpeptidase [Roseiflexaceae bacterium]